jgi:hypothetical protein
MKPGIAVAVGVAVGVGVALAVEVVVTGSLYLLAIATLYTSRWVMPDRLYPWLGVACAAIVSFWE